MPRRSGRVPFPLRERTTTTVVDYFLPPPLGNYDYYFLVFGCLESRCWLGWEKKKEKKVKLLLSRLLDESRPPPPPPPERPLRHGSSRRDNHTRARVPGSRFKRGGRPALWQCRTQCETGGWKSWAMYVAFPNRRQAAREGRSAADISIVHRLP